MPLKSSKIALQKSSICGRKLQLKPGKINRLNGHKRGESDNALPIDLSKRKDTQQSFDLPSKIAIEGEKDETVSDDLTREELMDSDEPLNLSTNGGSNSLAKRESINKNDDLLQKRVRLEEMVNYIRTCSVVEEPKYCVSTSGYAEADSEISNAESENDEPRSSLITDVSIPGHYGNGLIRLSYTNKASYPVLRQQLLRNIDENDAKSNVEEDDDEGSIDPHPHWSAYDYASYYASVLHDLQNSAAAQSLLMTNTSADVTLTGDTKTNSGQQIQRPLLGSGNRKKAPRALTGKHVKHGTGASPATLLSLRQKIEQKMNLQRAEIRHCAENGQVVNSTKGKPGLLVKSCRKKKGTV